MPLVNENVRKVSCHAKPREAFRCHSEPREALRCHSEPREAFYCHSEPATQVRNPLPKSPEKIPRYARNDKALGMTGRSE